MAANDVDRVWDLMEKMSICMLTTHDGEQIRSRPMGAYVKRAEDAVYFLADSRRHKDDEIMRNPNVCLAFADGQNFVSVTGHATVSHDRSKIRDLWSVPAKAWWDSPDDPNISVLRVTPDDAEFWETPGKVVSTVKMLTAAATSTRPDLGQNRKVAM
jgi:general stress protein 26